jgi:SAM-dependent methyltransferase
MRMDWDERALQNPRFFVQSAKSEWDDAEFFRSGEVNVANEVMPDIHRICGGSRSPRELTMVEIGCGVGRMTRMLSALFGKVYAVDVSAGMINSARRALGDYRNIEFLLTDGKSLYPIPADTVDFVFTFIVLQHIPSKDVIKSYFHEAFRILKPGGVFKAQLNGAAEDPQTQRVPDTWDGVRFSTQEMEDLASSSGFQMESITGCDTQYCWVFLRKPW